MGGGYEKLGNIATFAEVHVDQKSGEVKVVRVVSAFECGAIVNPDSLRNQIEGSNVQGLGWSAVRSDRIRQRQDSERQIVGVSRAPVQRCSGA